MALIQDTPLISTLVVGLSAAFIGGIITSKLRLSPIVGYLLAGIVIGPFTPGFIGDVNIATQLAEIGIILLMFGVGLHFSLKDLMEVKNIAIPGAIGQITVATALGTWAAYSWGWPVSNGLLFGLSLSVASTVVLLRALEEQNTLHSINGHIAVGWLIIEDLVIVLALVLIPALAHTTQMDGNSLWVSLGVALGKIILFLIFMFMIGKRFLPWMLAMVAGTGSRELFTLSVFVVAVGVAFGAAHLFGISFALGAFFAGMVIKESDFSNEVTEKALPFQDAFAVLFFVSVGMLFNPNILLEEPLKILIVVLIIMVGKSLIAFGIILLFRYPARMALRISASLAQIGEFSFILGTLGMIYGLLSKEANSLILAGALISITLNPLAFRAVEAIYTYSSRHPKLARWLDRNNNTLAHLTKKERYKFKDLVILVGYGRVGKYLQHNMKNMNINLVVIDTNRDLIELMRQNNISAIMGDATSKETLKEAAIDKATTLIVAIPNAYEARQIVEVARELKKNIKVLVRAHNDEELEYFEQQNVDLAVVGTQEIARRMSEYLHEDIALKQKHKI